MGRRAETIGIGRIEKGAEQICCGNGPTLSRRKRERSFGVDDGLHTFAQAGQFQHGFEAAAGLVDEVYIQPVRALIGKSNLNGAERPFQRVPDGFGPAGRIDDTPACAGNEILQGPDQSALTGGAAAPPFGESRLHDLGRGGPGHVEIKAAVFATQNIRFDVVEQL